MRYSVSLVFWLALALALRSALPAAAQPGVPPAAAPVPGLPHWQWQAPRPTGYQLSAFQALTDSSMIAVGTHGTALKTTDAGRHWQVLPTGTNRTLTSISFVDSLWGWVTGPSPVTNSNTQWRAGPGRVLRTTTGGRTWAAQVFEPVLSVWYPEVAAASATTACVVYQTGRINPQFQIGEELGPMMKRTTNGGQTWTTVSLPTPYWALQYISDLSFVSSSVGLVRTQMGATYQLLRTADAGLTWQAIASDSANGFVPGKYFFLDAQRGWLTGYNTLTFAGSFWHTGDGGLNWTQLPMPIRVSTGQPIVPGLLSFADPAHGAGYGNDNGVRFYATADSGATFTETVTIPENDPRIGTMQLRPGGTGWCVNANGIMLFTADYGQNWQRRAPTGPMLFAARDLTMTDPTHGWARPYTFNDVAATTSVLRTTTRGNSWPLLNLALRTTSVSWLSAQLLAAAFPDRDTAWVGGQDWANNVGFVLRTTDGGTTWARQTLPAAPPDVTELAAWGGRRVVAIGSGQALYVTRDAGQRWARAVVPGSRPLRRATWADSATIYVTTDSTTLLKSTDAGRTWQLLPPTNFYDPTGRGTKLTFTSALVGYLAYGENIGRTTDGGLTWTSTQGAFDQIRTPGRTGYGLDLRSLTFRNPREGWVVGPTDVFRTQDAGQTWALQAFVGADITAGGGTAAGYDQSSLVDRYNAFSAGTGITRYSEKYLQTDTAATQRRAYCTGDTATVAFDTTGIFSAVERNFRVELSNRMGRFRPNQTTILPLLGTGAASPLRAVLPAGLAAGTRYRLRVIRADSSVLGGDNARDLTIYPRPAAVAVAPTDSARFCAGDSVLLTAPAGYAAYAWSGGATTAAIWVRAAGSYTVRVAQGGGCFGPASRPVTVRVTPRPAAPTLTPTQPGSGPVRLTAAPALPGATYVWTGPGGVVAGASGPTLLLTAAAQNGPYSVTVTARGCVSPASNAVNVAITGLGEETSRAVLTLSPNPTATAVTLRSAPGLREVAVRDQVGRVVLRWPGGGAAEVTVPVAALPAGSYLVCATLVTGQQLTRRLLVQH